MLTKERLAAKFHGLARLFPGMPSYQEREALRDQDKVIRTQVAGRIDVQTAALDQLKTEFTNRAILSPLATLDTLCRTLQRLADSIRFASYGYAGLLSSMPVNEAKLAELYEYDVSLGRGVEQLEQAVRTLRVLPDDQWQTDSLQETREAVAGLAKRITERESIFRGQ